MKKPKDYHIGDILYEVWLFHDMFDMRLPQVGTREVIVCKVNKSSIYVQKDEKDSCLDRFKMAAKFPLKTAKRQYSSILRGKEVLTDNPNLAKEWQREIDLNHELNVKINTLAKSMSKKNIKDKQDFLKNNEKYLEGDIES